MPVGVAIPAFGCRVVFTWWVLDIATAGLVVASAIFFTYNVIFCVNIGSEAVMSAAIRTGQSRRFARVFEKVIAIFHISPPRHCMANVAASDVPAVPLVPYAGRLGQVGRRSSRLSAR